MRKDELERLQTVQLAVLCGQVANDSSIDDPTRTKAAEVKLEWGSVTARQLGPDFKDHQKLIAEETAVRTRMIELLMMV
jgi:hypothetical protein